MPIIAGEPEQLDALRTAFRHHSGVIQELTAALRGQLDSTNWQGPQAERFRAAWQEEYEPVLRRLEEALLGAGSEIAKARDRLLQAGS